ncbi:unnamed protein product [Phytomonas sp. EM1]|nr:unnamed protein product [Phytomonas sp. EM1]|eukprot:CCW64823.1 unnamed protein product [Phytomonas sp. isolate EM1]
MIRKCLIPLSSKLGFFMRRPPPYLKSISSSCAAVQSPLSCSTTRRRVSSTEETDGGKDRTYNPSDSVKVEFPIVQLPARTLWCKQYTLNPKLVAQDEFSDLIAKVKATRHYYQYPSLCAPQIGWNVQMFTLFDDSVFINPINLDAEAWAAEAKAQGISSYMAYEEKKVRALRLERKTGFAWEPCASCCFLMHYIERPSTVRLRALDEHGKPFETTLNGIRARMALHELDHLNGVLFTRRVVDIDHVLPLDGFAGMGDWSDDFPSLEARSTFLYSIFTPPYYFSSESVPDANLLHRKYEEGVYPGCEHDRHARIQSAAYETLQRERWRQNKGNNHHVLPAEAREAEQEDEATSQPPSNAAP